MYQVLGGQPSAEQFATATHSGPLHHDTAAVARRRKTKRTKRMRGSGKKRGKTKKCKCGPKCKSCGKYNCKKGRSCKCPPGCGKRRTRGGCGSRKKKKNKN